MKFYCPHCKTRMVTRTSRPLSLLSGEEYLQCPNIFCGLTCRVLASITHQIVPSLNPNPMVFVPVGRTTRLPQNPHQLDLLTD